MDMRRTAAQVSPCPRRGDEEEEMEEMQKEMQEEEEEEDDKNSQVLHLTTTIGTIELHSIKTNTHAPRQRAASWSRAR